MLIKIDCEMWLAIFGTLVSILLRACTTLHPHSGEANPPMYGDYEAQRHWMEITTNLPINDWYKNTTHNNLNYWGLDYPPLTAYHMLLCGLFGKYINENYTKLHESRGYESENHKIFMRYTVLILDILIFIPSLILYYTSTRNLFIDCNDDFGRKVKKTKTNKKNANKPLSAALSIVLSLFYPGIILIDHGHFQYNCVSLGFAIIATTFLLRRRILLASVFFCLALNYKQMELYHALPFFLYLLSTCVPKPGQTMYSGLLKLSKIAAIVLLTFVVIWSPFFYFSDNTDDFLQVFRRLFPVDRGVFEDKVSNFWCFLNIFYKIRSKFNNEQMMRVCLFATVSAILPSSIDLFLRPNTRKFVLSLINSSLAFFLFSFQVHEKSILLVAIPILMHFPQAPFVCFWFLCLTIFSMVPLLIKDNLMLAMVALTTCYVTSFRISIEHFYRSSLNSNDGLMEYYRSLLHILLDIEYKKAKRYDIVKLTYKQIVKNKEALKSFLFHSSMIVSLVGCLILAVVGLIFDPPRRYPDLYPVLISVYSFIHFFGFFIYFNVKQINIPQEFEDVRNVKVKTS